MKLNQLRYFMAVCKHNNITKAAAELHITQPSISNAIRDLEEEFGVALFSRQSKGLTLTEEGRYFMEKASDILTSTDTLTEQMRDMGNKRREILIGVPPMIGTILFPYMFQSFREKHPGVHLTIVENGSVQVRNLVENGSLDAAIVSAGETSSPVLESVNILDTETMFCVSTSHPLANCDYVDIDMIKDEPLVLFKEDSYQTTMIMRVFKSQNINPNVILYSSQLHTIRELVTNNIATTVLFKGIVKENQGIVCIPFKEPLITTIELTWNRNKHLYKDIEKFIDFTRKYRHSISR